MVFINRANSILLTALTLALGLQILNLSDSPAVTPARKPATKAPAVRRPSTTVKRAIGKPATKVPTKSVALNPNEFIQYINSGKQHFEAKRYPQAETDLKKALALGLKVMPPHHRNIGIIQNLLGLVQMKRGQYPASTASLKQAIAIYSRPENSADRARFLASDYMVMGQMAMYDGRFQEAEAYYTAALPHAETLGEAARTNEIRGVLADIARIDPGPDYLGELGATVTRWSHPEQPILVYVSDGAYLSDWRAGNKTLTQSAFGEWQQAMGTRLRFEFVDDPQAADIRVGWMNLPSENLEEQRANGHAELRNGYCKTQALNQFLFKDDIEIAIHDTDGTAYSDNVIHNTLLHEIAHAIGLLHGHSPTPGDVLFASNRYEDGRRKHLTNRDIATAHKLYDLPAQVTNPTGIHLARFSQYADLRIMASKAFNEGDYTNAFNQFQQALSIYGQDPETRFWMGMSAWKLDRHDEAVPYFMATSTQSGKYQGEALKLAGASLILSAQRDEQTGNRPLAEEKYHKAYQLLTQGLPITPMTPENAQGIQKTVNWLNQRLAMRSANVIQWANGQQTDPFASPSRRKSEKKKRGWFASLFEPSDYTSQVPVNIMIPGHMAGY